MRRYDRPNHIGGDVIGGDKVGGDIVITIVARLVAIYDWRPYR